MSTGLTKAAVERHQRIMLELLKQPGNDVCADCRTRNPRWASWNIGIFICVKCAGIHRKMGTHISKVKSVTLDTWTKEQVESMKSVGNSKANQQWNPNEAKNPPPTDLEGCERDSQLEKFIRKKYESRAFTSAGSAPPTEPVPRKAPPARLTAPVPYHTLELDATCTPRSSSAVGLRNQQPRKTSLQTSGARPANSSSTRIMDSLDAQRPSGVHSSFAQPPPIRPSTAPIPYAANQEPTPPLPPLPLLASFPASPNRASFRPGIHNTSCYPPTCYSRLAANHPVITPTAPIRTDGIWGDLLQLSNPMGSASSNESILNPSNGHLVQTSSRPVWSNSTLTAIHQPSLSNPSSHTSSYLNLVSPNFNPATNLPAPNQSLSNAQFPQQFPNQPRPVPVPSNLAPANTFSMSNFLPGHMATSAPPTNPFFNMVPSPVHTFPSNNPFVTAAIAAPNSFQPGGPSFSSNSMQPLATQEQQILQQQSTHPNFSFNNPYASTFLPQNQQHSSPFGPSLF